MKSRLSCLMPKIYMIKSKCKIIQKKPSLNVLEKIGLEKMLNLKKNKKHAY